MTATDKFSFNTKFNKMNKSIKEEFVYRTL